MPSPRLVRDLMTVGVPTCPPEMPVADLARTLLARHWEAVVVIDHNGHATGMVSPRELAAAYGRGDFEGLTAEDIQEPDIPTVPPDIPLTAAAQIMLDLGVRAVYCTHHAGGIEYPAAWLTFSHLLRHIVSPDGEALKDLGIEAERESPIETFIRRREEARQRALKRGTQS